LLFVSDTERRPPVKKKNIGLSFDSWLREEGAYEETTATAVKRVLARQIEAAVKDQNISKAEWPSACAPAATALGREIRLELV
jgi:hypothetical protein